MLVGHEGQPRSGKSYEAVKEHILPAIKSGRRVYARLNGLDRVAIAGHLQMPVDEVSALLVAMNDAQVHEWLVCDADGDLLTFPHVEPGALVVVDECHEYWPVGRAALPDRTGNFFAKHGHIGLDVVLISQDFKEVHRSVVRRLQRKNLYTKLDALGKDSSYSVRFYSASTPGKFELVGSEKREYDPDMYVLYHGIQPGVEGNPVYKSGSKTLWQSVKKPAILVVCAVLLGVAMIGRFFFGGGASDVVGKEAKASAPVKAAPVQSAPARVDTMPPAAAVPAAVAKVVEPPKPPDPPGIAYLVELLKEARPRYAGAIGKRHLVEFRAKGGGQVVERLTVEQIVALGWVVEEHDYGIAAVGGHHTIIFTPWPIEPLYMQSQQTADRITSAGPPVMSASESQPAPAAGSHGPGIIGAAGSVGFAASGR